MRPSPGKKVLIGTAVAIGTAIAVLGNAGDAYNTAKDIVTYILEKANLPYNTLTVILLILVLVILVALLVHLIKRMVHGTKKLRSSINEKTARASYLRWIKKDIDNRLRSSVHHARYIDLNLTESATMVFPWTYSHHDNVQGQDAAIQSIEHLVNVKPFSILLLGAPGAGKTTTLLNCIRHSIDEAENDEAANIPILVNLSKWRKKEPVIKFFRWPGKAKNSSDGTEEIATTDLLEWVVKMASSLRGAGLTQTLVENWMRNQKITLFLDGLDEAQESFRSVIVNKINSFLSDNPNISIIICSRSADYEALVNTTNIKLRLDNAVVIQPLTAEQISGYLDTIKTPQLGQLLEQDDELREMAKSPLDLSIMVLACTYSNLGELITQQTSSISVKRMALFDAYVKAMVQREQLRQEADHYKPESNVLNPDIKVSGKKLEQLYKYLGWIATTLSERSRSAFSQTKLYEYFLEKPDNKFPDEVTLANCAILLTCLALFSLVYIFKFSPVILIAVPLGLCLVYFGFCYSVSDKPKSKKTKTAVLLISLWPAILVGVAFLCLSTLYIFSFLPASMKTYMFEGWMFFFVMGYLVFTYFIEADSIKEIIAEFSSTPLRNHLINAIVLVIPVLFVFFFNGRSYPHWIFLYMLIALANAVFIQSEGYDIDLDKREFWKLVGLNFFVISAGITGILLFTGHSKEVVLLALMLTMTISMSVFTTENDYVALCIFLGACLTGLGSANVSALGLTLIAIAFMIAAALIKKKYYERIVVAWGSAIIEMLLKLKNKIPYSLNRFLRYTLRTLLLKRSQNEYEFMHRRIRDYFAIRKFIPLLWNSPEFNRVTLIREMCALKDASCDVFLELIDDHSKLVRMECLNGLGDIGSATAAKALLEAVRKTTGELNTSAIKQIARINDVAAIPLLINILDEYPLKSPLFQAAFQALADSPGRFAAWNNDAKIEECLNDEKFNMDEEARISLKRRKFNTESQGFLNYLATLELKEYELRRKIKDVIEGSGVDQLKKIIQTADVKTIPVVFEKLSEKNEDLAVETLIERAERDMELFQSQFQFDFVIVTGGIRRLLKKIIKSRSHNLETVLLVLNKLGDKKMERFLLQFAEKQDIHTKKQIARALRGIGSKRSVPFLLRLAEHEDVNARLEAIKTLTWIDHAVNIDKCISLFNENYQNNHEEICEHLITLISYDKRGKGIDFLMGLLEIQNPVLLNAVIIALGRREARESAHSLLRLFYANHSSTNIMKSLIWSLAHLKETSIIPTLVEVFKANPELRSPSISALIVLNAKREIIQLHKILQSTASDEGMKITLAAYLALCKEYALVADVVFPEREQPAAKPFQSDTLFSELCKFVEKINSVSLSDYENYGRISGLKKDLLSEGVLEDTSRLMPLYFITESEIEIELLDFVYDFDHKLGRTIAVNFMRSRNLGRELIKSLELTDQKEHKLLLIGLLGAKKNLSAIPVLKSYLKTTDDVEVTCIAMEVLGHLGENSLSPEFVRFLSSENETLVKSAIRAIVKVGPLEKHLQTEIYELVCVNTRLQNILINADYTAFGNQFTANDLEKLCRSENPVLRYLSAIYLGVDGHGDVITILSDLLEDNTPLNTPTYHKHTTVSQGALYALEMVGTPSAKTYADNWRMRNASVRQ